MRKLENRDENCTIKTIEKVVVLNCRLAYLANAACGKPAPAAHRPSANDDARDENACEELFLRM